MSNPWELYSTMKGWRTAHRALEKAWRGARKQATAYDMVMSMRPVMNQYREFGAVDSEPIAELDRRIEAEMEHRQNVLFGEGR